MRDWLRRRLEYTVVAAFLFIITLLVLMAVWVAVQWLAPFSGMLLGLCLLLVIGFILGFPLEYLDRRKQR